MLPFDQRQRNSFGVVAVEAQELTAEQKQKDVFEAHRHRVFSVSYYMTANEMEAEQILTGTFVEAFTHAVAPDAGGVDRALLGELERRFSLASAPAARVEDGGNLPRGQVRRTDLEEGVRTLPPRERLVFLLRDVEGYDAARIGTLLGIDEAEVCRTLISARIRMRNALGQLRARAVPVSLPEPMHASA